jgi:zinc protease
MTSPRRARRRGPSAPTIDRDRIVLANGIRILVHENPINPVVSIRAHVETGLRFEPEEKAGVAFLTGRLLDAGTRDRTAGQLAGDVEYMGAHLSTGSQGARCKLRSEDLDRGLRILAACLRDPVFPTVRVDHERDHILREMEQEHDSPRRMAALAFDELVYGRHPYHRSVRGRPETLRRLRRRDVVAHHRRYFVPGNLILVLAGDLRTEEVVPRIEDLLGDWKGGEVDFPSVPRVRRQKTIRRRRVLMSRRQIHLCLGHLGVRRTDPDFDALNVLDSIFGRGAGFTDRISRRLRDEEGLAYSVGASITTLAGLEPGTFQAYIGTRPENRDRAVRGVLEEIERIRQDRVTAEELRSARTYLIHHHVFGFETNSQRCAHLLFLERYGLGLDHLRSYPDRIRAVTADAILEAARRHLDAQHYSLAIAGPK